MTDSLCVQENVGSHEEKGCGITGLLHGNNSNETGTMSDSCRGGVVLIHTTLKSLSCFAGVSFF